MVKIGVGNTTYKRRLRRGMPCFETPGPGCDYILSKFFSKDVFLCSDGTFFAK